MNVHIWRLSDKSPRLHLTEDEAKRKFAFPTDVALDERLSLSAKGLLACIYAYGKATFTVKELEEYYCAEEKRAIRNILKELETEGYVDRVLSDADAAPVGKEEDR